MRILYYGSLVALRIELCWVSHNEYARTWCKVTHFPHTRECFSEIISSKKFKIRSASRHFLMTIRDRFLVKFNISLQVISVDFLSICDIYRRTLTEHEVTIRQNGVLMAIKMWFYIVWVGHFQEKYILPRQKLSTRKRCGNVYENIA